MGGGGEGEGRGMGEGGMGNGRGMGEGGIGWRLFTFLGSFGLYLTDFIAGMERCEVVMAVDVVDCCDELSCEL